MTEKSIDTDVGEGIGDLISPEEGKGRLDAYISGCEVGAHNERLRAALGKDKTELLEVLAICHSAIRTARCAILRQYDTFRAMDELGIADFKARAVLAKFGRDPFAKDAAA